MGRGGSVWGEAIKDDFSEEVTFALRLEGLEEACCGRNRQ